MLSPFIYDMMVVTVNFIRAGKTFTCATLLSSRFFFSQPKYLSVIGPPFILVTITLFALTLTQTPLLSDVFFPVQREGTSPPPPTSARDTGTVCVLYCSPPGFSSRDSALKSELRVRKGSPVSRPCSSSLIALVPNCAPPSLVTGTPLDFGDG